MNNGKFFLLLTGAAVTAAVTASPLQFNSFKASQPRKIVLPATDTTDQTHKFNKAQLLDAKKRLALLESQDWTTVASDTAGFVETPAQDSPSIRSFMTNLRASRFVKGKLNLKSTAMAEVKVNGNSLIRKEQADSAAISSDAPLTLDPEKEYEILVNIVTFPDDASEPRFALEFIPDKEFENVEISASPNMKRRFEIEDINLGKRVQSTELSPDGKYLITRYSEMFDANNTNRSATLQETATGKIVDANLDQSSSWMPKGSRLYRAVSNNGDYDIYVTDAATHSSSVIAKGVPTGSFTWSPDETYLIYYDVKEGEKETGTMRRVQDPDDRMPGNRDRAYLMKYDLATGLSLPITYGGASTSLCDISADGKKILYLSMVNEADKYPFYFNTLVEMDAKTLKTDTLVSRDPSINGAIYSPDAKSIFITGGPAAFSNLGKNSGDLPIANDFDTQGYIFDISTRTAKPMTFDFDPAIEGQPVWNKADGKIYFRAEEGFYYPLFCLDPKSGKISKIDTNVDYCTNFSIGDYESQWISYTGQAFTYIGQAWLLNLRNGKARMIDNPMANRLSEIEFGEMQPWKFTASDGTVVDGFMTLPPDFDASKKYPLIVYYYGGTSPSSSCMHHAYTPQLFASRDYVVYVLNPSGTTGYGQEYSARHVNAWGDYTADEIIEGVKKFCKDHPFVDDKKVGCLGASYGGFMTQLLQTKTDIFAAAVSHAGISNVTSYWGEGYWGYSYNAVAAAQSYPWTNPDLFTKHGSLFNADKIHTPLLLLHGSRDTNVPIGESIQLFNALKVLGRQVEFITVDDQDHVITDYEKRKVWQATIMAWFARYLQDSPQWWDSMYGTDK